MDLIDRDKLIEKAYFHGKLPAHGNIYPDGKEAVDVDDIEDAPTVDAVEVVHGRWELYGNDDGCGSSYFCSSCHGSFDEDLFYMYGQYRHFNYCPNCGARMDAKG